MTAKPKHTPSVTRECVPCCETYFGGDDTSRCEVCGELLTVRVPGTEPFAGCECLDADEWITTLAAPAPLNRDAAGSDA